MHNNALAFMSYVRSDDDHDVGRITRFRERLEGEVRMQTGMPFPIFQDRNDLEWGQHWESRINESLANVTFLIPVITPSFFVSPACRSEFQTFASRERTLGLNRLILPLYYVTADAMNIEGEDPDEIAQILGERQWTDWREFRFKAYEDERVAQALAEMASGIKGAIADLRSIIQLQSEPQPETNLDDLLTTPPPKLATAKSKPSRGKKKNAEIFTSLPGSVSSSSDKRVASPEDLDVIEARPKDKLDNRLFELVSKHPYYTYTKQFDEEVNAEDLSGDQDVFDLFSPITRMAKSLETLSVSTIDYINQKALNATKDITKSVLFLVDNSGSLRGEPIIYMAGWLLFMLEQCERHGIQTEVIGFTTRGWKGGRARELWISDGRPPNPGRLADLRHIIYKSFDDTLVEKAPLLGVMTREGLLKENIDGEALAFAIRRMTARQSDRKLILVLSDGAPMDDSTAGANNLQLLPDHLRRVVNWTAKDSSIRLAALGLDTDPKPLYGEVGHSSTRHRFGLDGLKIITDQLLNEQ